MIRTMSPARSKRSRPDLLAGRYPWITSLPAEGRSAFAREYELASRISGAASGVAQLEEVLCSWKATAAIYADPPLLAKLTAPLAGTSLGRVPRP
jgi:hypothetical protein